MELAVLILLNLVFLVIFYILFSIRVGRALEKNRKSGIPREFYQNVEMIVHYLDATLESVNQKNDALYRLLVRADALKAELEALLGQQEKSSRRRGKKSAAEAHPPEKSKSDASAGTSLNAATPRPAAGSAAAYASREEGPGSRALDRLLSQSGEDRVEWTRSEGEIPELIGARRDRSPPLSATALRSSAETTGAGVASLFAGVGRLARKWLGGPPDVLSGVLRDEEDETPERPRSSSRSVSASPSVQSDQSFEERLYGYSPAGGKSTRLPYPARDRSEDAESAMADHPPQTNRNTDLADRATHSPARSDGGTGAGNMPEEAYFPEGAPTVPAVPSAAQTGHTSPDFPDVPDLSRAGDRAAFVRSLLRRGMGIDEIAGATGISYQEIEFIQKVMDNVGAARQRHGRRDQLRGRSQV